MDPVSVDMLRFVPAANRSGGNYQAVPTSPTLRISSPFVLIITSTTTRVSASTTTTPTTSYAAALLQFPVFRSQYSGLWRQGELALPAIQPQPHLDHKQFSGQRSAVHLHARRAVNLSAPANDQRSAGFMFIRSGTSGLLRRHLRFQYHQRLISSSISDPTKAGITTGLPSKSHWSSVRVRLRWLRDRQWMGRRIAAGRQFVHVG